MNECNFIETDKANLAGQSEFRLNEISKLKIILTQKLTKRNHGFKN